MSNFYESFSRIVESIGLSARTWFHGTTSEFEGFSMAHTSGQLGLHFGSTKEQALWRMGDEPGFLYEVRLNIRNPIGLIDTGSWQGYVIIDLLKRMPQTKSVKWYDSMSDRTIRQKLIQLGYDSVIYKNRFEGEIPAPSVIVFNESQITVLSKERVNQ